MISMLVGQSGEQKRLVDAHGYSLSPDGSVLLIVTGDEGLMKSRLGTIRGAAAAILTEGPTCRQWALSLPQCRTKVRVQWAAAHHLLWVLAPIHVNWSESYRVLRAGPA